MANRLSEDKARAIAEEYCSNGRKKRDALRAVGYKESYACSGLGMKLYDNILVKRAIAEIDKQIASKAEYTREQAQQEYEQARALAMTLRQPSAATAAVTGKARLFGLDIDRHVVEPGSGRRPPDKEAVDTSEAMRKALHA